MRHDGSVVDGSLLVALAGRVYCWADASNGPIEPGDMLTTYADISKSQKELGYSPKVSLEDGIQKFVEWYRKEYSVLRANSVHS